MPTRALRRFALGFASMLALAGAARAGEVTYPQLGTATTVQDTDLIATWRASGPLTKVQASVLEAYLQGKLSPLFLQPSNNLSDLGNVTTARTNLGLGSAALANTGTTGTALCQLNSNCTWTGTEAFNASVTMGSTLSVTGATTLAGAATLNGGLTVSGVSFLADGAASAGGDYLIMRPTDFGPGKPEMFFRKIAGDNITWNMGSFDGTTFGTGNLALTFANITQNGQLIVTSGEQITGSGLNVTGGFTLNSGPFTLPAGSVANADLDTVNSSPGTCTASQTTACGLTVNAQGRVSSTNSAQVHAAISGATAGALETNDGTNVKWAARASAYFSSCSNFGCTMAAGNGISGATRQATGNFFVNFSSPMPNTNYTVICTAGAQGASNWNTICVDNTPNQARSTSGVDIELVTGGGGAIDNAGGFNILVIQN